MLFSSAHIAGFGFCTSSPYVMSQHTVMTHMRASIASSGFQLAARIDSRQRERERERERENERERVTHSLQADSKSDSSRSQCLARLRFPGQP